MPGYGGKGQATLLRENQQGFLFLHETNVAGKASVAFQLERVPRSYYPWGASFQAFFTDASGNPADPGTFEIDIQTSDIDDDGQYVTLTGNSMSVASTTFVARLELTAFYAKFVRAFVKSLTNASVFVTVLVTR
jgi:hypothetical protein